MRRSWVRFPPWALATGRVEDTDLIEQLLCCSDPFQADRSIDVYLDQQFFGFDDFYSRGYRRCAALAFVLTGSTVDADDLVQDAFSITYRRWSEIASYDDPLGWVRKVMVNKSMSRRRRFQREIRAIARGVGDLRLTDLEAGSDDRDLWGQVSRLPKQQAAAIALFYIDDLSVESIGTVMGCSIGTVKTHLSRGCHTLAARLVETSEGESNE